MGHHNAQLDPLGISCVNFDDAPVNTGFQDVGENARTEKTNCFQPVVLMLLFPPTLPFFSLSSLLSLFVKSLPFGLLPLLYSRPAVVQPFSFFPLSLFLCQIVFRRWSFFYFGVPPFLYLPFVLLSKFCTPSCFWSARVSTSSHLRLSAISLHVLPPPPPHLHPLLHFVPSCPPFPPPPSTLGGLCAVVTPCRSEGTMWPSWTPSASWTPIWTRVSPLTLSLPPTSWVRS